MKKIDFKMLFITSILCLLPILLGLYFYSELPDQIAIHFDINNNPDNYFSKSGFVFGMPVIMVLLQAFACIVSDLSNKHVEANKKTMKIIKLMIPIMVIILYIVTIMIALGNLVDVRKVAMFIVGVMFIISGNYMPKTKGMINGIKNLNEKEYNKISKILGYTYIINGFLCILSIFFHQYVSVGIIALVIIESIILCIYAHKINKKD